LVVPKKENAREIASRAPPERKTLRPNGGAPFTVR
jgi:hypothetical protein